VDTSSMRRAGGRARRLLRDPVTWTEWIQIVKTVVAAVVAWMLAVQVFDLPQPFLAPWSALLVVHATVYRSFSRGAKQVGATVVGVLLAWATGDLLGLDAAALAVMLLAGLVIGNLRWLREESTTVGATALVVLTTGFSDQDHILVGRLLDTSIGVAVGLVVNVLVWPPLRDVTAARAIDAIDDRIGNLLQQIGREGDDSCTPEQVEAWIERSQEIDVAIDEAWALVRQAHESGWYNPRRHTSRNPGDSRDFPDLLDRMEQAVAEIRSMARTLGQSISLTNEWDDEFRGRWLALVGEAGQAIANPDSERVAAVRRELSVLASDFSTENLPGLYWTEYGGLILNLRNVVTSMDRVAASQPVTPRGRHDKSPLLGG